MSAPVPFGSPGVPLLFSATYQTKQFDTSIPGAQVTGPNGTNSSVFDAMDAPEATGVAAEAAINASTTAKGVDLTP